MINFSRMSYGRTGWTEDKIKYLVEASDNEALFIYQNYSDLSYWKQDGRGGIYTLGKVALVDEKGNKETFPVNVELSVYEINGELVGFWNPCSQVVHYGLIEEKFFKLFPNLVKKTNSDNFHHIFHYLEKNSVK